LNESGRYQKIEKKGVSIAITIFIVIKAISIFVIGD
tara:strand:- start:677 stop:784 length:108 start_codon:yes stop_codon:yes gene_type:complete